MCLLSTKFFNMTEILSGTILFKYFSAPCIYCILYFILYPYNIFGSQENGIGKYVYYIKRNYLLKSYVNTLYIFEMTTKNFRMHIDKVNKGLNLFEKRLRYNKFIYIFVYFIWFFYGWLFTYKRIHLTACHRRDFPRKKKTRVSLILGKV